MALSKKLILNSELADKSELARNAIGWHHYIETLQKVIIAIMIISVIFVGVVATVNIINPDAVIGDELNSISLGMISIDVADELVPSNTAIKVYGCVGLLLIVILLAFVYYFFQVLKNILKPMTEDKPFSPTVSKNLKKLGFATLALGIIINIIKWLETFATAHFYNIEQIIISENIKSFTVNYNFDLSFLIICFVLFFLSYIFKYGEQLQQLSDETV